jgi:hypothetical protein
MCNMRCVSVSAVGARILHGFDAQMLDGFDASLADASLAASAKTHFDARRV